jgi:hypothetical protein
MNFPKEAYVRCPVVRSKRPPKRSKRSASRREARKILRAELRAAVASGATADELLEALRLSIVDAVMAE